MLNHTDLKTRITQFFSEVWGAGNLDALPKFWSNDCVNHAAPLGSKHGQLSLRKYHEGFQQFYANLSDVNVDVQRQIVEGDTVVTHMTTSGIHAGEFLGFPATGRKLAVDTIRIDRFDNDTIAEHWSVTDMAGLMAQLQG